MKRITITTCYDALRRAQAPDTRARDGRARPEAPILLTLRSELNLSDEQTAGIREAIEEARRELREVRFEQCPGLPDARQHLIARVRPLLTPEQQQRFDAIINQRVQRGQWRTR